MLFFLKWNNFLIDFHCTSQQSCTHKSPMTGQSGWVHVQAVLPVITQTLGSYKCSYNCFVILSDIYKLFDKYSSYSTCVCNIQYHICWYHVNTSLNTCVLCLSFITIHIICHFSVGQHMYPKYHLATK